MRTQHNIPSLDGLRALSIALVIIAHSARPGVLYSYFEFLGPLGVSVFFVISGFLITRLLLKESAATGRINLKRFYLRRFFRIFPPYYTYLALLGVFWAARLVTLHLGCYLSAVSYVSDYYGFRYMDWDLTHTWSLSIEEQFYLFWPACLFACKGKRAGAVAVGLFLASPFIRLLTYIVAPPLRPHMEYMFHTRIDTLMCGCLIALLYDNPALVWWTRRLFRPAILGVATLFLFIGSPLCIAEFHGYYGLLVRPTMEALCIGLLLLYFVRDPQTLVGRILNTGALRHIGVISYSLYLWQQPWMTRLFFPLNVALAVACAELSFRFIERPSQRLRDAIERRLKGIVPTASVA